ncbi:MAG TPA: hypothetical protein VE597_10290, partial [Geminicoccaceae bacterium]|nr:hypothetical protein [Geminicoccaceae bacterium]
EPEAMTPAVRIAANTLLTSSEDAIAGKFRPDEPGLADFDLAGYHVQRRMTGRSRRPATLQPVS